MNRQWKAVRNIGGIALWGVFIIFCAIHRNEMTPEAIAASVSGNPWLAAAVLLAMFALKSVSVFFYAGILYAASGILFPLPIAVLVNLCGTAIMTTLPYCIGKRLGTNAVQTIVNKFPKVAILREMRGENDFWFSFLSRANGVLPSDVVSFYMGAIRLRLPQYLAGCLLGMLPTNLTFPLMGMNIRQPGSADFLTALSVQVIYSVISVTVFLLIRKRKRKADGGSE